MFSNLFNWNYINRFVEEKIWTELDDFFRMAILGFVLNRILFFLERFFLSAKEKEEAKEIES